MADLNFKAMDEMLELVCGKPTTWRTSMYGTENVRVFITRNRLLAVFGGGRMHLGARVALSP